MSDQKTCATCGKPIGDSMKFCRHCGAPVGENSAPAAAPVESSASSCPSCGSPVAAGSKFCKVCGASLASAAPADPDVEATPAAAGPSAVPTTPAAVAPAPAAAAPASVVSGGLAKAQSSLSDFMGSSIDASAAGSGFDAGSVKLDPSNDAALSQAFAYFGKAYSPAGQPSQDIDTQAVERRKEIEAVEEEARAKEERDFSVNESGTFYGEFATKLQAVAAPKASMVAASRDEAFKRQHKNRLKHAVALGDMDKAEAVGLAEK